MIALVAAALLASACAPDETRVTRAFQTGSVQAMDEARFWAIVDRTAVHESDPDRQVEALRSELEALSVEEVVAFRNAFEAQLARAYTWDLWAAAYIAHGSASDDGFEYFRRWMVSKGRAVFERLLARPDDLPDLPVAAVDGVLEFEEILYVTDEVWAGKTGMDGAEMPGDPASMTWGGEPSGEPFDEDPQHLAQRLPKTWARFGNRPLG